MGLDANEKILADYNDVFADIMNVLLYDGKEVIGENDLENTKDRSLYKIEGKIHEQERDVSKIFRHREMRLAFLGIEHQNKSDRYMPLRVISYDGSAYRAQLLKRILSDEENRLIKSKPSEDKIFYPFITLVLYFGLKPWNYGKTLYEVIDIPDDLKPYVNDYKINLVEVAWLDPEKVSMFKSDFRLVADFFVQKKQTGRYIPPDIPIKHVDEFLKLLCTLVGDERYLEILAELNHNEDKRNGGKTTMCEIYDWIENNGIQKGIKQGIDQERVHTLEAQKMAEKEKKRADALEEEVLKLRAMLNKA